ncbi:MAG: polymorphic toxin-type HINT domain-containing protein [Chitinophagaceae bacterium]
MNQFTFRKLLLAIICLLQFSDKAFATSDPPVIKVLAGSLRQIAVDSSATVEDSKFFDPLLDSKLIKPYRVTNRVTLRINEFSPFLLKKDFDATVSIRVFSTRAGGATDSVDQTLAISYFRDSIYASQSTYRFEGAYRVRVKILDTASTADWGVWQNLVLENELHSYPVYNFSCTEDAVQALTLASLPAGTGADEIMVSWGNVPAADEYDLEWTYVDSSSLAAGVYGSPASPSSMAVFRNSSSRVTVRTTQYGIPLLYDDKGTLFVRVRSVKVLDPESRIPAQWSSDFTGGLGAFAYNGHERSLNWQATTNFSEEGKRKSKVQYFDGSLRERQAVSKDNFTGTTIVAEGFYDYQGRGVVNVLPAPTLDNIIHYSRNFHVNLNGDNYSKDDFDITSQLGGICNTGALPMSPDSGAARYYSDRNPEKNTGMNAYLPDAQGYPFVETQYSPDNTSRIVRQSFPGDKFRIGSGHERRFYYGSPDQQELDALFGTEAGLAVHYGKTMARSSNGQYSVTYTNMLGKIVATALAGEVPDSIKVQDIPSQTTRMITESLAAGGSNTVKELVMETKKSLLVSSAGTYDFSYRLDPETLQLEGCDSTLFCYNCLYDLSITITDDCGNQLLGGQPFDTLVRNFTLASIDTSCAAPTAFSLDFSRFLEEGNYDITKRLMVNTAALAYYRDSVYFRRNLCRDTASFINEQDSLLAVLPGCIPTCASCVDSLGTWTEFRASFMTKAGIPVADSAGYRGMALEAFKKAQEDCQALCQTTTEISSIRQAMLLDLTPSSGQYANPDAETDKYSVFYTDLDDENAPDTIAHFRKPLIYLDADGNRDYVFDEQANALVQPSQLSAEAFSQKFKLSWANALLPYHPEYCKLLQYEALPLSHAWDVRFAAVETYQEALKRGYLNPTNNNTFPFTRYPATSGFADYDPLASMYNTAGNTFKNKLETHLLEYRNNNIGSSAGVSAWGLASIYVLCKEDNTSSCFTTNGNNNAAFDASTMCEGDLDMAWRTFRQMYLDIKREIITTQVNSACNGSSTGVSAATLMAAGHQPHFAQGSELMANTGFTPPTNQSEATLLQQQSATKAGDYYSQNCLSYVLRWWKQLGTCNFNAADSAIIIPRLLAVCQEGSDQGHPMGSSTVRPSSGYRFRSFDEVLRQYADSIAKPYNTNGCHVFLITEPPTYEKPISYGPVEAWEKPGDCQCSVITDLHTRYVKVADRYASFAAFVNATRQTTMSETDLQTLLGLCKNEITCKFLPAPIVIPPALQCGSEQACIDCDEMAAAYSGFLNQFSGAHRITANTDSLRNQYYALFTNFMNARLGYSKSYTEYKAFMDQCGIPYYAPSTTAPFVGVTGLGNAGVNPGYVAVATCDTLQNILSDFASLYPGSASYRTITVKRWETFTPVVEYLLAGGGIHYPYPPAQVISPEKWIGSGLRDSGYAARWFRNNLTFARFDFGQTSRNAVVDSINLKLSPVLSAAFNPEIYWCNMASNWDTTLTYGQLTTAFNGARISTYTPLYQRLSVQGNPVYTFNSRIQMMTYVKFSNLNKGHVLTSFMNPALTAGNSQTFIGSTDSMALADPETRPRIEVLFSRDSIYHCRDLLTGYFNFRLKGNFTFEQLDSLYALRCGSPLMVPCSTDSARLCGRKEGVFARVEEPEIDNCSDNYFFAVSKGTELFLAYRDSVRNKFEEFYRAKCLNARYYESFTVTHQVSEYHYTLYYYDLAGNLVKTVPPAGVHPNFRRAWYDSVKVARDAGTYLAPAHGLATQYRYNGLNELVSRNSPDGGILFYWYDRLGRTAVSQDARQQVGLPDGTQRQYTYVTYDDIGRMTEVGGFTNATANHMTDGIARNPQLLADWLSGPGGTKKDITRTVYDLPYGGFVGASGAPLVQRNLRNRTSYISFTKEGVGEQYNHATFFTYDVHGNADTLIQDYGNSAVASTGNPMNANGSRFKKVAYKYDLLGGNVLHVAYQPGKADQFFYRYDFDAENRPILVETSADSVHWEKEARYQYYKHGTVARVVLGDQQVQGIDYAYTLRDWEKGHNSTALNPQFDMGKDGYAGSPNQFTARDAFSYTLNYYRGDYVAISGNNPFPAVSSYLSAAHRPQYNGNISSMATHIGGSFQPLLFNYTYDQLSRLVAMDAFGGLDPGANNWSALALLPEYKERVAYDPNGNITHYLRQGGPAGISMDSLTYHYPKTITGNLVNNRLDHVRDNISSAAYLEDLDNQDVGNYTYDAIGNLVTDASEGITGISWNIYGKIESITKTGDPGGITKIEYSYDAIGNRVSKTVTNATTGTKTSTWYVRDGKGNVMSTYVSEGAVAEPYQAYSLKLTEHHLYGGTRVGVLASTVDMKSGNAHQAIIAFLRGQRSYELGDHLGNVHVTISDKKLGVADIGNPDLVAYFDADVLSRQDYYPFGMLMPGRGEVNGQRYRYGFNSKENDNDVKGVGQQQDYGLRIYDPRLGRFLSNDPLTKQFPWWTPYQFAGNSPVAFIDLDGAEMSKTLRGLGVKLTPVEAGFVDGFIDGIAVVAFFKTAYNLATDEEYRDAFAEAIKTAASDPVGFVEMIINDYKEKARNIIAGNEQGQYELGYMAGETVSGILSGGALKKFLTFAEKFRWFKKFGAPLIKKVPSPCGCLTGETLVETEAGPKPIASLQDGDAVLSFSDSIGGLEIRKVYNSYVLPADTLFYITLSNEIIRATRDHPFLTKRGWLIADSLSAGDSLRTKSGRYISIIRLQKQFSPEQVYNFEVTEYGTYVIGENGVIVHNASGPACNRLNSSGFYVVTKKGDKIYIGKGKEGRSAVSGKERKGDTVEWYSVDKGFGPLNAEQTALVYEHLAMQDAVQQGANLKNAIASPGARIFEESLDGQQKKAIRAEFKKTLGAGPTTSNPVKPKKP